MAYIRTDKDCDPANGQPSEAGVPIGEHASVVVPQKISCIEYEVYNGDYQRSNLIGGGKMPDNTPSESGKLLKQPDIFDGWNGDYIKYDIDNNVATQPITGASKADASMFMVTQNPDDLNQWYIKRDIDGDPAPVKCYRRKDAFGCIPHPVAAGEPAIDDPTCAFTRAVTTVGFTLNDEEVLLALQDDRDNIIVTEDHIYNIRLESNTVIDRLVEDNLTDDPSIQLIVSEMDKELLYETDEPMRVEEL